MNSDEGVQESALPFRLFSSPEASRSSPAKTKYALLAAHRLTSQNVIIEE